jgi:hypothetical protein
MLFDLLAGAEVKWSLAGLQIDTRCAESGHILVIDNDSRAQMRVGMGVRSGLGGG